MNFVRITCIRTYTGYGRGSDDSNNLYEEFVAVLNPSTITSMTDVTTYYKSGSKLFTSGLPISVVLVNMGRDHVHVQGGLSEVCTKLGIICQQK